MNENPIEGIADLNPAEEPTAVDSRPAGRILNSAGQRRALRWLVPVGAAGVVAVIASGALSASANPNLQPQTAAQLLAAISNAEVAGFSGTVVEKASLGLPQLPNIGGQSPNTGLLGMLTGSHTSRIWYGGQTKQRVAMLDSLGEQDVFRNGTQLWQWDSNSRTAVHTLLPADAGKASPPATSTLTPDQAAKQALSMIDPSTKVSTDSTSVVAGRSAYTLVLTPRDTRSRVGSVRISVDGKTKIPLGVQLIARGKDKPALDVAFTRISFSVPSDNFFNFAPPPNATVKQGSGQSTQQPNANGLDLAKAGGTPIGKGWTTVVKLTGVPSLSEIGKQSKDAGALLDAFPEVKGSWGTGRLFSSALLSALFTSDGTVYVGAVDPDLLYQAAEHK
ncbi:MAG TPA: hypothetical protein VGH11_10240 [Jatrophihabitans sp.]|jgi:outer membrane lipoprotein-sorting protein